MRTLIARDIELWDRSDWGENTSLPRLGYNVPAGFRSEVIFHHTVIIDDDASQNVWETEDEVKHEMRRLQIVRPDLGLDVPYNFVLFLMDDGRVILCEGRGLYRTGAHTHGHNTSGVAISLHGDFDNFMVVLPTTKFSRICGWLKYEMGLTGLHGIYGHQDFAQTACPGMGVHSVLSSLIFELPEPTMEMEVDEVQILFRQTGLFRENEIWFPRAVPGSPDVMIYDIYKESILRAGSTAMSLNNDGTPYEGQQAFVASKKIGNQAVRIIR